MYPAYPLASTYGRADPFWNGLPQSREAKVSQKLLSFVKMAEKHQIYGSNLMINVSFEAATLLQTNAIFQTSMYICLVDWLVAWV